MDPFLVIGLLLLGYKLRKHLYVVLAFVTGILSALFGLVFCGIARLFGHNVDYFQVITMKSLLFVLWDLSSFNIEVCGEYSKLWNLDKAIYESNHIGYSDWMIALIIADVFQHPGMLKILCAKYVAAIPIIGQSLINMGFPMLSRNNKEADTKEIKRTCNGGVHSKWIVLFPEGTFTDNACAKEYLDKQREYCDKNNIQGFSNDDLVLMPRKTGYDLIRSVTGFDTISVCTYAESVSGATSRCELVDDKRFNPSILDMVYGRIRTVVSNFKVLSGDVDIYEVYRQKNEMLKDEFKNTVVIPRKFTSGRFIAFIGVYSWFISICWILSNVLGAYLVGAIVSFGLIRSVLSIIKRDTT